VGLSYAYSGSVDSEGSRCNLFPVKLGSRRTGYWFILIECVGDFTEFVLSSRLFVSLLLGSGIFRVTSSL